MQLVVNVPVFAVEGLAVYVSVASASRLSVELQLHVRVLSVFIFEAGVQLRVIVGATLSRVIFLVPSVVFIFHALSLTETLY